MQRLYSDAIDSNSGKLLKDSVAGYSYLGGCQNLRLSSRLGKSNNLIRLPMINPTAISIPEPQIPNPGPNPLPSPEPTPGPAIPQPLPEPVPEPVPAPIPQTVPGPIPQTIPEPV